MFLLFPFLPPLYLLYNLFFSPLFFLCFSVFSCSHCLTVDALLLSSLLPVFMSQNVQDRHNRRGYNVENLEISIMVDFFLLNWLHKWFPLVVWTYTRELRRLWGHGRCCERMAHVVHDGWCQLFIWTELQEFKQFSWIFIWNWKLFNLALTSVWWEHFSAYVLLVWLLARCEF